MRIAAHISFFYNDKRIPYLNRIIRETNLYDYPTDLFIHTNRPDISNTTFDPYTNGTLTVVSHDLSNIHPHFLTWKCRDLLREQRDDYEVFMYLEDDILVPRQAITYWREHYTPLLRANYNLGFVRIETGENGQEYITDLYGERLDTTFTLENTNYCVNNKNPYCAFWIYDREEFGRFVDSPHYDMKHIPGYGIREMSAFGLHDMSNPWYQDTLIPLCDDSLHPDCRIYHMPNNYVTDRTSLFATIPFTGALVRAL
jgi:hypothetical protein